MKKIFILSLAFIGASLSAQINASSAVNNSITGENAFLDVSSYSAINGWTESESKGLAFPETDLTKFVFKTDFIANFPTAFNGMIVYNTAPSGSTNDPALTTQTVGLTPGFYYFYNPTGSSTGTVTAGRWLPIGGTSPKVDVLTTETATNTLVAGKQVYAMKGQFTATGSSTAVNIPAPTGMTALYGITIYKAGTNTVYDRSLYSYTIATTAGNAITGSPSMSVVYPNGTYDYVIEYLK